MAVPRSLLSKLGLDSMRQLLGAAEVLLEFGVSKVEDMQNFQETLAKAIRKLRNPVPTQHREWMSKVSLPDLYAQEGFQIKDTAARGISLQQLENLGAFIETVLVTPDVDITNMDGVTQTWEAVSLYVVNTYFIKPLTWKDQISFVELVANTEQTPSWFVSHWWGTAFHQSLRMLRLHHLTRKLDANCFYWMCSFANNQHELDKELSGELSHSPFLRVLRSEACRGAVALMDSEATPFSRIWCVLEAFEVMKLDETRRFPYDVAAWLEESSIRRGDRRCAAQASLVLDDEDGTTTCEEKDQDWAFPWTVAEAAAKTQVTEAQSTRAEDKETILKYIQGKEKELDIRIHHHVSRAAMHGFCMDGNVTMIAQLLHELPDLLNERLDSNGATPAFVAAQTGRVDALRLLIDSRADINKSTHASATPSSARGQGGHQDGLRLPSPTKRGGKQTWNDGATPAFIAAQQGQLDALQLLISSRADIEKSMVDGSTPTFVAAQHGQLDVLRLLISSRADVEKSLSNGSSPTFIAAQNGHVDALRILIFSRTDINRSEKNGATPTYIAAQKGQTDALRLLISSRAHIDIGLNNGETPTFVAAETGQLDALRLLIRSRANTALCDHRGTTPLAIAGSKGHKAVVQELLNAGAI